MNSSPDNHLLFESRKRKVNTTLEHLPYHVHVEKSYVTLNGAPKIFKRQYFEIRVNHRLSSSNHAFHPENQEFFFLSICGLLLVLERIIFICLYNESDPDRFVFVYWAEFVFV